MTDVEQKKINKELVEEFPFLTPRNVWTDQIVEDYDYEFTLLDDLPEGWYKRFGLKLCEDLKKCLEKADYVDRYRIVQIKEKYGTLRWYDNGVPVSIVKEYYAIINYYTMMSRMCCQYCGRKSKFITTGWICFTCDECLKKDHRDIKVLKKEKQIQRVSSLYYLKLWRLWIIKKYYSMRHRKNNK